jgi:hypothetical protein
MNSFPRNSSRRPSSVISLSGLRVSMLLCRESEHPSERERAIVVYSWVVGRARLVRSVLAACVDTCHPCHPADHLNGPAGVVLAPVPLRQRLPSTGCEAHNGGQR